MIDQKYRPTDLAQIVGQDDAVLRTESILRQATQNGPDHSSIAVLYTGPTGVGKTTLALAAARELNAATDWTTCLIESRTADLKRITQLEDDANTMPFTGRWKSYVIDECHEITKGAANYLLGLLERMPPYRAIFATTTDADPWPDNHALTGRFLTVKLTHPEPTPVADRIIDIARRENLDPLPTAAQVIDALKRRRYNIRQTINDMIMQGQLL